MSARALLADLSRRDIAARVDGGELKLSAPKGTINADLLAELRPHKPALIAELKRRARRDELLLMLADNPGVRYAFAMDTGSDPVILAVGVRDVATFEMTIPADRFDGFRLLRFLEDVEGSRRAE